MMPRFIKEYANFKKKGIENEGLIPSEYKSEIIKNIDNALSFYELGIITIDETMKLINTASYE